MTRESGWSLFWLLLLVAALGAFLYWYWSPALPFSLWPSSAAATGVVEVDAGEALGTESAPVPQTTPAAQPTAISRPVLASYCPPGQHARFVLGFEQLKARLGTTMGEPLECEHVDPENGDTLQQTTTGLAVYRKEAGVLEFTDGWRHWALRGEQLVAWEGDSPPSTPAAESAGSVENAASLEQGEAVRIADTDGVGVALRSAPNEHSRTRSALAEGAVADALESTSGYVRVRAADGREGWVPERYLDTVG
jgi:hypothetical protein